MDSNSSSVSDKEGAVGEMEHGVTMSDIKEVEMSLGTSGEDKPTRDESPAEFVRVGIGKTLAMDSNSGSDKEGSIVQTEHKVKVNMSEVDQRAAVGDKQNLDENSVAQLVKALQEALKLKQMTRREAWQEKVKVELEKRAEHKRRMERTPRSQITSWKDKQMFSKISVQARKTFLSERTQFLFNEMFPILDKRSVIFHEILTCRLVSKEWKDAIDSSISTTSEHFQQIFAVEQGSSRERIWMPLLPLFSLVEELKSFNQKSDNEYRRGMNPFPFRQLYIGHPASLRNEFRGVRPTYWIEMEKLLQRWGKVIWTAFYVFDDGSIDLMHEYLIKYLSLMPNLRELAIVERDRTENSEIAMLRSLRKSMEEKALPELPHLHSVMLGNFTPAPLIKAVLEKYGNTLQCVRLEGPGLDKYSGEYVDLAQYVSGRVLPFTKFACFYGDSTVITHWKFQFPALNELRLLYGEIKESSEVANIFKTVNSCGSSIRRLKLVMGFEGPCPYPGPIDKKDWRDRLPKGIKLELPHLEWLDLTVDGSKIEDVDFLLPLVSLREMTFTYRGMKSGSLASAKEGNGIIQFPGYEDGLYDSNIWTLLPEVRLITLNLNPIFGVLKPCLKEREHGGDGLDLVDCTNLTTTVYTREGYQQHQSDQGEIQRLTKQKTAFTAK